MIRGKRLFLLTFIASILCPAVLLCQDKQPIFVVDLSPQGGKVPADAPAKITQFLRAEMESSTNLVPFPGEDGQRLASGLEATFQRNKLETQIGEIITKARNDYLNLDFSKALGGFGKAREMLISGGGRGSDVDTLVEVNLQIANTYLGLGKRKRMRKALQAVLELRPDFKLDSSEFPPALLKQAEHLRKKLKKAKPGSLSVSSEPSQAKVLLDGMANGGTPLLLEAVLPGKHSVCLELAGHKMECSWVAVKARKRSSVSVNLQSNPAVDAYRVIAEQLAGGALRESTVAAAAGLGKAVDVTSVLVGGVGERAGQLIVSAALVNSADGRLLARAHGPLQADLSGLGKLVPALAAAVVKESGEASVLLAATGLTIPADVALDFDSYLFGASVLNAPKEPEVEVVEATLVDPAAVAPVAPVPDPGKIAPEEDKWYKAWWLWTVVGVVVAGGAITAGVLLAPEDVERRPNAIDATIILGP